MHVNKTNGKVYIGQTKKSYCERWHNGKGYGKCSRFAKAIEKYGWDDGFEHIPLIEGLTKSEADYFERFFIEFFDAQNPEFGYNLTAGGDENPLDNPVVRAKFDESMKKRSADPEWQKKHHEFLKKLHADPEWKEKQREGAKKRSANPEWRENVCKGVKKRCTDPEWWKNVSEANRKKAQDPEWRKKNREVNRNKAQDPEWQENQRVGAKKRSANPEWRENVCKGAKKRCTDPEWRKNVSKANQKRCKKVLCVETKIVYDSLTEAAIAVNLKTSTPICMCCGGKYKTAGGYHWEYA